MVALDRRPGERRQLAPASRRMLRLRNGCFWTRTGVLLAASLRLYASSGVGLRPYS